MYIICMQYDYMYVYIYIYIHILFRCIYSYIYIYIHTYKHMYVNLESVNNGAGADTNHLRPWALAPRRWMS